MPSLIDTSIVNPGAFQLTPQTGDITQRLLQVLGQKEKDQQIQQIARVNKLKEDFGIVGDQMLRVRGIKDYTSQRKEMAILAQNAIKRGEDPTVFTNALNIDNPDEMNLYLDRVTTQAGKVKEVIEQRTREASGDAQPAAKTIETADGIKQWNPETRRYDIPVGKGKPTINKSDGGFKDEKDLRKEFLTLTKTFRDVRDSFARVQASSKSPSPAGDLSLIFNYMKMLDPQSVVRESEFAQAAAAGSWGERIKAAAAKITQGEKLSSKMRNDFVSRSKQLIKRQKSQFNVSKGEYTRLAKEYDLNPSRVIVDLEDPLAKESGQGLPDGVSEEDIVETMRANNMTRQQVLDKLGEL